MFSVFMGWSLSPKPIIFIKFSEGSTFLKELLVLLFKTIIFSVLSVPEKEQKTEDRNKEKIRFMYEIDQDK